MAAPRPSPRSKKLENGRRAVTAFRPSHSQKSGGNGRFAGAFFENKDERLPLERVGGDGEFRTMNRVEGPVPIFDVIFPTIFSCKASEAIGGFCCYCKKILKCNTYRFAIQMVMHRENDALICNVYDVIICCCCAGEAGMHRFVRTTASVTKECFRRFKSCVKTHVEPIDTFEATLKNWHAQEDAFLLAIQEMCKTCAKCKKRQRDLYFCSVCTLVGYCSAECQREDWKTHKVCCGKLKDGSIFYLDTKIKILRV